MKKLYTLFVLLFLSTNALADIALYTRDSQSPHAVNEMYELLKNIVERYPDKNLVYYVHGRNKKVEDEWKKIPKMEDVYNVKVIMLHWDAYDTLITRPVKNAELTSHELQKTFEDIKKFRLDYQSFFESHSLNLLCHSMGNLVLRYAVENYLMEDNDQPHLFENFVSVGADVPMNDHYIWMSHLNFVDQKYVMMNNRDIVLLL
jgi:esterase/lipase superfamily enzyme